jgi:hypothetical protein
MMNKPWIHQVHDYGLGNFINLTPTIRLMFEHLGHKIPVFFDLEFIRDCFLDCELLFNSKNNCPDYLHVYKEITKAMSLEGELPHTYVDIAKEIPKHEGNYTLFIRGSGSEDPYYCSLKMPDNSYYQEYERGKCIFTGSQGDYDRLGNLFHWQKGDKRGTDMEMHIGDIRKSLALVRDAKLIVANDTGLAHAAGAMNKNIVILWKNTSLPRCSNPGKNTIIRMCHE